MVRWSSLHAVAHEVRGSNPAVNICIFFADFQVLGPPPTILNTSSACTRRGTQAAVGTHCAGADETDMLWDPCRQPMLTRLCVAIYIQVGPSSPQDLRGDGAQVPRSQVTTVTQAWDGKARGCSQETPQASYICSVAGSAPGTVACAGVRFVNAVHTQRRGAINLLLTLTLTFPKSCALLPKA